VAAHLIGLGVAPRDRVAIWLPNHPDFVAALYGAWRVGATVVPVHSALTEPEARHILNDSGARILITNEQKTVGEKVPTLEHLVIVADVNVAASPPPITDVADDDLALIAYTAGTSGLPKGAMLTHANLKTNLDQMQQTPIAVHSDDVALCILPLFHIFGLNVVLNLAVSVGARLVLFERFDAASTLDAIRREGVTVVAGAPPVFVSWLGLTDAPADAFGGVRLVISGAAPLPNDLFEGFRDRFGVTIWQGYGLTETSPAVTWAAVGGVAKPGSIGRPLPGVELRLVDEDGDDVEEGDPGEVIVRGPNVFKGYWGHPDETEQAFRDGWFRTGDIGVVDDDGDLFLVDRRNDLIIVSGFNVYPREIEDVLRRHPHVGDCAVVGTHDARSGEAVRAIVVSDPPGESVTEEEIFEFCRRSLAPYKVPASIEFVSEIPRNAAGKVLRRALR
jgi:long-chain acyl-CoA synthetase